MTPEELAVLLDNAQRAFIEQAGSVEEAKHQVLTFALILVADPTSRYILRGGCTEIIAAIDAVNSMEAKLEQS